MATHSSVLPWRIPGMGEPDGLPSMGSHRVGHDWSDLAAGAAEKLKKKQSVMNNTTTEMKNTLEGCISELEDRKVEITKAEQNKEKRTKRNKDRCRDLWDNTKHTNIWIIEVLEEQQKEGSEKIFEEFIFEEKIWSWKLP